MSSYAPASGRTAPRLCAVLILLCTVHGEVVSNARCCSGVSGPSGVYSMLREDGVTRYSSYCDMDTLGASLSISR